MTIDEFAAHAATAASLLNAITGTDCVAPAA